MTYTLLQYLNKLLLLNGTAFLISGCMEAQQTEPETTPVEKETVSIPVVENPLHKDIDTLIRGKIETGNTSPLELSEFAKTLIGVPYLYASTDPAKGFDCSGFISYVFNHFNISVPRSSIDFTDVGKEIFLDNAATGDLILFTGTDSTIRIVGHMGIVESNNAGKLFFIHATSGKAKGVVVTEFGNYYKSRFVKVIRLFPS